VVLSRFGPLYGPRYHFSDTWQLVINTATTIITFLMVFMIQNTQNRDARAIQLKLDELIRAVKGAKTGMVRLEEMTDEELQTLAGDFEQLRARLGAEGEGPNSTCSIPAPPHGPRKMERTVTWRRSPSRAERLLRILSVRCFGG
jgi:low affinity Fe/Cu permease